MNRDYEKELGENIRKLRIAKGKTQDELATAFQLNGCDITRSALAKIEVAQRHIYADEIVLLKSILSVDFDEILLIR